MNYDTQPPQAAIDAAIQASTESVCLSQRGVAIFDVDGRGGVTIISTGYNALVEGECTRDARCKSTCARRAIHAEQEATLLALPGERLAAQMLHVKTVDGKLVPSGPPSCLECAKLIRAAGIFSMWLYHKTGWRHYDTVTFYHMSVQNSRDLQASQKATPSYDGAPHFGLTYGTGG